MNILEDLILKEKLRKNPNYDYIRWLQQLSLESFLYQKNLVITK
jgi:hypothetical protein